MEIEELIIKEEIDKPFTLLENFKAQAGYTIDELASMSSLEYDRIRKQEAKRMGIRLSTLDAEVKELQTASNCASKTEITMTVEAWAEPIDGKMLANIIFNEITSYVVMPKESAIAITLWVMLTYVFDSFLILPILAILSPQKRCGKTNLMSVLFGLTHKALMASNISNASIYRVVEKEKPTILMDEFDTYSKENESLRGILNSGHNIFAAKHIRVNPDTNEVESFDAFAPKAIAMIGKPKDTIIDRSLIINLSRKKAEEIVKKQKLSYYPDTLNIRRQLKRWADDNAQNLQKSTAKVPDLGNDRMTDNWGPLFAIAENIDWGANAEWSMKELAKLHDEDESIGIMLLQDIYKIFLNANLDRISSEDLVNTLVAIEDKPWGEWYRGNPITKNTMARHLKQFAIKPKTIRIGTITKKGYDISQFKESFSRYLPPKQTVTPSQVQENNDLEQFESVTETRNVTVEKEVNKLKSLGCYGVTDTPPAQEGR